jgi:hypothetical protein
VIAERCSRSRSVSDAMMRTIPKSIKRLSNKSRSPRTHGGHTNISLSTQMFAPEKISWRPAPLLNT